MLKQLDLTSEQKTALKELRKSAKESNKARKESSKKAREVFRVAIANPATSKEDLSKLHENMITLKMESMRAHFEKMLQIREILNDDQRAKFHKMMEEKHKKNSRHHRN